VEEAGLEEQHAAAIVHPPPGAADEAQLTAARPAQQQAGHGDGEDGGEKLVGQTSPAVSPLRTSSFKRRMLHRVQEVAEDVVLGDEAYAGERGDDAVEREKQVHS
jgi:hypothetical protein